MKSLSRDFPGAASWIQDVGQVNKLAANHHRVANIQAVGLDLFHGMVLQARKRCAGISWVQGNSANPPFANASFDYITNQFSYHHFQDKIGMIAATFRILKPGGRFVITNLDPWSIPGWIVYTYFPTSRERDLTDFLPIDQLTALMQTAGFCKIGVKRKQSHSEEHLSEFLKYASQRHRTSRLMTIRDDEYVEGIAKLKEDIEKFGMESRISSEICLVWVIGDKP